MILYILLSALFLLALVLSVAERRRTSKELKQFNQELHALNEAQTRFELLKSEMSDQTDLYLSLSGNTPGLLNSTRQEQYDEYRKRGGTDDIPIWIMKNEMHELFP
ncbi:MAG: hypothetical protein EOM62_10690 [Bacteroidia bacterium]|nr:hypothetical protein [Bacteroidia bacterium]